MGDLRPLAQWPQALEWVRSSLAARGLTMVGAPETLKVRPWSSVARMPVVPAGAAPSGSAWFKANGPGSRHEPALLALLAGLVPGATVAPIAVEVSRGWSVQSDGGPVLRGRPENGIAAWERFVEAMAVMQVALVDHRDALLATGLPDLAPATLPEHLAALLDDDSVWTGAPPGLRKSVRTAAPVLIGACARLEAGVVPMSLQHNDLHDGNVLLTPNGPARFFDWGDSYVGHPFGVLLVTLRRAQREFSLSDGDPALDRLRETYLRPWLPYAPMRRLVQELESALVAARVAYVVTWRQALLGADRAELEQWRPGLIAALADLA